MTGHAPLAVRRFTLAAVLIPAALTALAVVIQLIALPHVPDPIALHWGADGEPNGFGAPRLSIVLTVVVGFGVVLRSGPAIRVHRRNGKTFTVTVEDAATGAALLGALSTRTAV